MTRVPLIGDDEAGEVVSPVFAHFYEEGREPIALYRALANAPELLRAYAELARSLRHDSESDRAVRELAILRTAQLVGSEYEWRHHLPMAAAAGVTSEQVEALAAWEGSGAFDERERAALRCAEEVHAHGVTDEGFAELERALGRRGAIELSVTAAFYQFVARMIQALDVDIEPAYAGDAPAAGEGSTG